MTAETPGVSRALFRNRKCFQIFSSVAADHQAVLLSPGRRAGAAEASVGAVGPAGGQQESSGGRCRLQRLQNGTGPEPEPEPEPSRLRAAEWSSVCSRPQIAVDAQLVANELAPPDKPNVSVTVQQARRSKMSLR